MHQYITQLRSEFHTQNENVVRLQHDDLRAVVWSKNEVLEAELKAELRAAVQTINDLKRTVNSLYARESEDGTIDFDQLAQVRYATSMRKRKSEPVVKQKANSRKLDNTLTPDQPDQPDQNQSPDQFNSSSVALELMQEQLGELRTENEQLQTENDQLRARINELIEQGSIAGFVDALEQALGDGDNKDTSFEIVDAPSTPPVAPAIPVEVPTTLVVASAASPVDVPADPAPSSSNEPTKNTRGRPKGTKGRKRTELEQLVEDQANVHMSGKRTRRIVTHFYHSRLTK
ncbi:uncharacterized protein PHALS_10614 [Plasmopara halstedii]|uniref:Uncharacterized protein n=1 Tax=Plasmopara halstedii TaxID=4781 RepID=A0A0P1AGY8_PLAHL|nr:uncharacterized protein PHALS_10614 [Plasmopara halstedii]CEG40413.1 hypothetical protein PHALS_10614 [Plasmopara halstedii]|eukprot:XP_024576782.1 hypothetical protein PHALS_10614 [Plasmopara halstedii]